MDINYTLVIMPQKEPFYYLSSVVAQFNDVCKLTNFIRRPGLEVIILKVGFRAFWF
jgi:hypothetical protein